MIAIRYDVTSLRRHWDVMTAVSWTYAIHNAFAMPLRRHDPIGVGYSLHEERSHMSSVHTTSRTHTVVIHTAQLIATRNCDRSIRLASGCDIKQSHGGRVVGRTGGVPRAGFGAA